MKTQPTKKDYLYAYAFLLVLSMTIIFGLDAVAQDKTKSEWVEKTTVEIPYSVEINVGTTKSGNPKYWIDIEDMSISVSEGNYKKFINKEIVLVLVEWYNPTTGKYKYTTRQKAKSNVVKKLNLDELW
jgi:hypothetical protein